MARSLHITIKEASNLLNLESDKQLNPYVVLRLKNQDKKDFEMTEVKSNTSNPVWNQKFNILAIDPNDVLLIDIYNKSGKKDEKIIEELQFPVNSFQILKPIVRKEIDLKYKKKKNFLNAGRLLFEIEAYPPDAGEDSVKTNGCKIHIKCFDAKDVMKINLGAKPDPYLMFSIRDNVVKSNIEKKTTNPVWNQELDIISTNPESDNLEVELIDNDLNRNEQMMNPIIIPLADHHFGDHYVFDDFIKLKRKNAGKLHFELDFSKTADLYVHRASEKHEKKAKQIEQEVHEIVEKPKLVEKEVHQSDKEPEKKVEKEVHEIVEETKKEVKEPVVEQEKVEKPKSVEQEVHEIVEETKQEVKEPVVEPEKVEKPKLVEEAVQASIEEKAAPEKVEEQKPVVEPETLEHVEKPTEAENDFAHINGKSQFKIESLKGVLIKANRLPKTNSNGSDTYAVVTVVSKAEKDRKADKVKTVVHHNTQDPVWNKKFDFRYLREGDTLRVEVFQSHKIVGDQCIAFAEIPLKCISENKQIEQTYQLQKPAKVPKAIKKVTDFGTITFSLTHNVQYN